MTTFCKGIPIGIYNFLVEELDGKSTISRQYK